MTLACASACLVTDPVDPRGQKAEGQNHPPQINDDDVKPKALPYVLHYAPGNSQDYCNVSLLIPNVIDEDIDDQLVAKWKVDGNLVALQELLNTGSPVRSSVNWEFRTSDFPPNPSYHAVQVFISDGFVVVRGNSGEADPSVFVQKGMGLRTYTWVIDTHAATQCEFKGDGR